MKTHGFTVLFSSDVFGFNRKYIGIIEWAGMFLAFFYVSLCRFDTHFFRYLIEFSSDALKPGAFKDFDNKSSF